MEKKMILFYIITIAVLIVFISAMYNVEWGVYLAISALFLTILILLKMLKSQKETVYI